jgi:galactitol-specific phosphotransferase system IIC component
VKEKFAKLIDVKTIVTLALVAAAIAFVAVGKLESKVIENLVVMAVSFYLGTKIAEKPTP